MSGSPAGREKRGGQEGACSTLKHLLCRIISYGQYAVTLSLSLSLSPFSLIGEWRFIGSVDLREVG